MPPIALWWWTGTGAASAAPRYPIVVAPDAARAELLRLALERPGAWREHIWWGVWAYAAPRPHPAPIPPGRWYTLEATLDPGGWDWAHFVAAPPRRAHWGWAWAPDPTPPAWSEHIGAILRALAERPHAWEGRTLPAQRYYARTAPAGASVRLSSAGYPVLGPLPAVVA